MKILQLRFENLNSLVGQWQIDFSDPAFAAEGIFAITGPTGAGKSSILDAICLALYGRTPRLGRITKSSNEIMSRQTGECFAEVTFATPEGRYRCHWSHHRSRRKADGELQQPKQELVNADSGEVLESKLRDVEDAVVAITGMDFERFTRSVMLAQGGFAAFLQASPDARAPILEQITGTEIYSRISMRTHELQREQQDRLKLLQAQLEGVRLLDSEQEQELRQQHVQDSEKKQQLQQQVQQLKGIELWQQRLQQLEQQQSGLLQKQRELEQQQKAFAPQRSRLALALQAAELEPALGTLQGLRRELEKTLADHAREKAALPELEQAIKLAEEQVQQQSGVLEQARATLLAVAPKLRKVRALDQQLQQEDLRLQQDTQTRNKRGEELKQLERQLQEVGSNMQTALEQMAGLQAWFTRQAADEWLVTGLAGVEQQLEQLQQQQARVQQGEKQLQELVQQHEELVGQLERQRECWRQESTAIAVADTGLQEARAQLARLLNGRQLADLRYELEHLQDKQLLLARIQSLEEQRHQLQHGQPCPLCGATGHPYADGQVPQLDGLGEQVSALVQLIRQIEQKQEHCLQHEREHQQLQQASAATRDTGLELKAREASLLEQKEQAQQNLAQLAQELVTRQQQVQQILQPLGVVLQAGQPAGQLVQQLRGRRDDWLKQEQQRRELEQQQQKLEAEAGRLQALADRLREDLQQQEQALQACQQQLEALQQQRLELFGRQDVDAYEHELQQQVTHAEHALQQHGSRLAEQRQDLARLQERTGVLEQRRDDYSKELAGSETAFNPLLAEQGFASEQALQAALLSAVERQQLQQQARRLDEQAATLHVQLKETQDSLAAERERQLTSESPEAVQEQLQQAEDNLLELHGRLETLGFQLQQNEQARKNQQQLLEQLGQQQDSCRRWSNLHELIGSADGKKFRNFAQGLTFELMVVQANRTLQQMSDRYLLVRDTAELLELNVVDNYQAGEVRSTKNLSGGESFIVSLALALGLSRMASQNVRVDSLFLDEGFGTLDEEALDVALDTLSGLQQDGKLIGVISHVQALKERIATQIHVQPLRGGRSRLTGPGCSQPLLHGQS